jgi:exopolyphosphatase/guanosine-5'-triphosphate,3'-diphosphate pyrophosphatase
VSASDLAGFASSDQKILSHVIRCHRKKLSDDYFEELPDDHADLAIRLAIVLRFAVLIYRSRSPELPSDLELHVKNGGYKVVLHISEDWLQEHPLTLADLEREESLWKGTNYRFSLHPV